MQDNSESTGSTLHGLCMMKLLIPLDPLYPNPQLVYCRLMYVRPKTGFRLTQTFTPCKSHVLAEYLLRLSAAKLVEHHKTTLSVHTAHNNKTEEILQLLHPAFKNLSYTTIIKVS